MKRSVQHRIPTLPKDSLPPGWAFATIGELVGPEGVFTDGDWVVSKDQDPSGNVRLIQLADIGDGYYRDRSSRFLTYEKAIELGCTFLEGGDLLIARMPDPLGRACIFPGDSKRSITAVDVCIVRTGSTGVNHRWLMYAMNSLAVRSAIASLESGSTRKRISRKNLARIEFPLPPLPEQKRIVDEIEKQLTRLDAGLAALKRAQAKLQRYKAAVLKAACEGRLVPTEAELARAEGCGYEPADQLLRRILAERHAKWEAKNPGKRYKEPAPPDTSELPELLEGWVWASLPQIGELARGKSKHRPRNDERLFGGPYPFVQTGEIRQAEGTLTTYSQTYSEFGLAQSRLWPPGTLCITIAANIAETALLGFEGCFPDSVVGFIPEDGVDVRFVEYFIRTVREELERYAPATAQKNINLKTLQDVAVPLPPLTEQHRIVAEVERRLSVVQELEKQVEAALQRAERLRQAILKRAFEGRLVPQNPDDEPASVLLERIQAGKARRKVEEKRGTRTRNQAENPQQKDPQQLRMF